METIGRGVLDTPLSRSMTASARAACRPLARAQAGHDLLGGPPLPRAGRPETAFFLLRTTVEPFISRRTIMKMVLDDSSETRT